VLLAFNIDKSDEWQQAETLITNYKNMLEQREGLQTEVKTLEQEKNKLEEELQARLNDKVNDELAFPPSSMIQMDCEEKKDAP
jgi:cell division protein FtsB